MSVGKESALSVGTTGLNWCGAYPNFGLVRVRSNHLLSALIAEQRIADQSATGWHGLIGTAVLKLGVGAYLDIGPSHLRSAAQVVKFIAGRPRLLPLDAGAYPNLGPSALRSIPIARKKSSQGGD